MRRPSGRPGHLSRRRFIQGSALVGSQALALPFAQAAGSSLEGYASATSVPAGGTLDFFLRDPLASGTATSSQPLTVTRIGVPDVSVLTTTVAVGQQQVPADASTQGCRWARSYRLVVPAAWPSGLYFAFVGSGTSACIVPFVVRPASPTPGVKTLLMVQATTTQAYNAYGGKSLYDHNSSGGRRAAQVSLDRPLTDPFRPCFDNEAMHLARWMARNGLAADCCTDLDLVADPGLLQAYQLVLDAGHDEYWTLGRRQTFDGFVARGGNVAFLGGNTCWFQARLAPGSNGTPNRTLVCYKDALADPVADPALKTTPFVDLAPPNPENRTTGLGSVAGCSWTGPQLRPAAPWLVMREEHWGLAGTGLARGASFGGAYVGYECDAARFSLGLADLRAYPTGTDGSPATLRILGLADASNWNALSLAAGGAGERSGHAMIAVFSRGAGTVFNTGSIEWTRDLLPELEGQTPTPISRITRNIVERLRQPWQESADVRQFRKTTTGLPANCWYGTDASAPAGSGMGLDGLAFRALVAPGSGTAPVYRHRSATAGSTGTRYRLSLANQLAASGSEWVLDGVAFHAYPGPVTDGLPVYEHGAWDAARQEFSAWYSTSATPPAGFSAGPVVFHSAGQGAATTTAVAPSFTLEAAPALQTLRRGGIGGGQVDVVVRPRDGFSGVVSFSVTGLPAGLSGRFVPTSSPTGSTLQLGASTAKGANNGQYVLTITGTAGALSAQTQVRLRIL